MPLAGDGVAGGVALVLLIAGLFVWFKLSRKRKATPRGKRMVAYEDGTNLELVDESLDPKEYEAENAKKIIEIALRPIMSEIVVLLKSLGSREHSTQPTRRSFVESVERVHGDRSTSTSSSVVSAP
ncbi:hypothetical protein H0E87_008892 [Populus deltoides]|uniref:Uncharacterized protein n=1 Tax=Populus deltoides TaxID=3696 RepID=A0A8T2Z2I0_POPDE|nr:hypothetical protein H0E87_008892 [Populus deltoides]